MGRVVAAIALGSNIPPREEHLAFARGELARILSGVQFSSIHETDPEGVTTPQGRFLNQAAIGTTDWTARRVLGELLAIEERSGRARPFPGAPRTLDLDLILYGDELVDEPGLTVPHPRFRARAFVLEPLAEIAPQLVDPVSRETVAGLLRRLRQAE
jgi:2-amino-4-hydroxy-6-hydroxymethyldihydropteridine diphosphokinase